nr:MAK10-like protein [Tanacetum cinerariifolium]
MITTPESCLYYTATISFLVVYHFFVLIVSYPFSSTTIVDENPIRTLGDYSKPSHEGYRNTIELPEGNNVVPLRSDTIRLVQNECSFHGLWSEDPNQHLNDFLKLMDSLDLDSANRERTHLHLFQIFFRDQASNWLERLPAGSITTWEDLLLNDPRDFAKPLKAISLPQDVPSTSDHHLIELENQVQCLIGAYLAPTQPTQVNKITSSCEIGNGPHNTQHCMKNPKHAFVEYASLRTDEEGVILMDTAYGRRGIRRTGNCLYAFSCEELVLIRRISFPGYGVLVRIE